MTGDIVMATHSISEPLAARPPKPSSLALGEGAIVCTPFERACKMGLIKPIDQEILTWRCWHRQHPEIYVTQNWPLIEKLQAEHWRLLQILRHEDEPEC
jgi:hypothetical protein